GGPEIVSRGFSSGSVPDRVSADSSSSLPPSERVAGSERHKSPPAWGVFKRTTVPLVANCAETERGPGNLASTNDSTSCDNSTGPRSTPGSGEHADAPTTSCSHRKTSRLPLRTRHPPTWHPS